MQNGNVQIKENRTSASFLASGILNGPRVYSQKDFANFDTMEKIQKNEKISEQDKEDMIEVLEGQSEYKSFIVLDKNDEYRVVYNKGSNISTMESAKVWISTFVENPMLVIKNYVVNYLATTSIYNIRFEGMNIVIDERLDFVNTAEIGAIGFRVYENGIENVFPLSEEYEVYAQEYRNVNKPVRVFNWMMKQLKTPDVFVMKISFLLLPISTIISIITVFITKNRYDKKYNRLIEIITILFSFSFLHILMHALFGSTIDRYTMPAVVTTFIGMLLSIYAIVYRKKYKIDDIIINNLKKEKKEKK